MEFYSALYHRHPGQAQERKGSTKKPVKPEDTMGSSQEKPAPATGHASPDQVPGPSQPDTSVPVEPQELPQDLPPDAVTLDDVRAYLAAAGEEERAVVRADLTPDTQEGSYQANFTPVHRELWSFPTQNFVMHQNPDESVSIEHHAITVGTKGTLTHQDLAGLGYVMQTRLPWTMI